MHYINNSPNDSGNYGNPMGQSFDGCINLPDELIAEYISSKGFVEITLDGNTVMKIHRNEDAYNNYSENHSEKEDTSSKSNEIALATTFMLMACTTYTDEQALQIKSVFAVWPNSVNTEGKYTKGQYIMHKEQLYRIEQDVQPIESQPPDGEGMLAVYRPVDVEHEGTLEDPIPWVYGMNCYSGKHYSYNGNTYRVADGGDMIPCTWPPDTDGMWQWELVVESSQPNDDVEY